MNCARGTLGHANADLVSVVRTRRGRLHGRRLQLTSAAAAQERQHVSATAYARTLLHSCVHVIRALTWYAVAALPLCAARQLEIVRQRRRRA